SKLENSNQMLIGVNFDSAKIGARQNKETIVPPENYIRESFKIFADNGLNCVRIPFYWESFEKDPNGFMHELEIISNEADKNDIKCIYDNHQWECSSFLGQGIGFPNSLLAIIFGANPFKSNSSYPPRKSNLEKFWNLWWDRKIIDKEKKDGWESQLEFLNAVIDKVDDKKSTYGFEILNEPQVFRSSDFKKVSEYHTFIIENLGKQTDKPFFFSYVFSNSLKAINFPWIQSKIRPTIKIKNKIIFDIHPYPPYYIVLCYYKIISMLMKNHLLFAGEFNSGVKDNVTISSKQLRQYIKRFSNFSLYGATFWWWSYTPDNNHPAFNLIKILENKIYPNDNFEMLVKSIRNELQKNR
ncbi:MAG: cellulase family glycosylhydrolase, partial [Candidatus Nitrosocosmicus sp.]